MRLSYTFYSLLKIFLFALLVCQTSFVRGEDAAANLSLAITPEQVAWDQCAAYADGRELPPPQQEELASWLGLGKPAAATWTTGVTAGETRHFRVVFKQPVLVGTLCSPAENIAVLKADAPLPGDMTNEAHWQPLPRGQVRPFDKNTSIRAVRITLKFHNLPWESNKPPSIFPGLWLLQGRFYNPAEFGFRQWSNPNAKPPAMQWLGYWPEALPIAALLPSKSLSGDLSLSVLPAEATVHPRLAATTDWRAAALTPQGVLLKLSNSVRTQAMRLLVTDRSNAKTVGPPPEIFALVSLADDAPTPNPETFTFQPPSPVALKYESPLAGFVAVRVEDANGRHVRRLIAETERPLGAVREEWNLQDDNGRYVAPGKYRFVGVVRPPLKLTYEATVYNAGHPPWMAPVPGGGWWMADHAPPMCVCAVGDVLFFGAGGAEFGTPLIATDLEGKKLWHDLHQGAVRLVSDGRYAYVVNNNEVVRIDPQNNFEKQVVHKFQYSPTVPGHAQNYIVADNSGAAAFGKQLCVSYSAPSTPWITSAVDGGKVDIDRCLPKPRPGINVHVTALHPSEEIFSAFQMTVSSLNGKFGSAPQKGPLANTLLLALKQEVPLGSIVVPRGDIKVYALRPGQKLPAKFLPSSLPIDPLAKPKVEEPPSDSILADLQDAFDPKMWICLSAGNKDNSDRPGVAVAEAGLKTQYLVFQGPKLEQLDYSLLLDRRYRNATEQAKFISLEGEAMVTGGWKMRRPADQPISYGKPAVAGYVWSKPTPVRGFMLTRPIEWAGMAVDVWNGPADAVIDEQAFRDNDLWKQVHVHRQTRNHIKFSWHTNRVIHGDFGAVLPIRAIRLRVIDPPQGPGAKAGDVVGGFESLITFEPLGHDAELPIDLAQRVTVLDLPTQGTAQATVREHLPLPHPTALTFDRQGKLYVACDEGICCLDALNEASAKQRKIVLPANLVGRPRALSFDKAGLLYVLDGAAECVRVFDLSAGKQVRQLGKSGNDLGHYDPTWLLAAAAMAFDAQDKLWLVEQNFQPKRISRWNKETGQVEKQLFGPTHYGGGGMLDPGDKTVINHLGMKFRIDYATRDWKLEARLAPYGGGYYLPDRVTYYQQHRYLIGDRPVVTPFGDAGPTSIICEEVEGVAVHCVATGLLGDWQELPKNPELQKAAENVDPSRTFFIWSDLNADRLVQATEVQFLTGLTTPRSIVIGDDLSLNFPHSSGGVRLRVAKLQSSPAAHVPVYDLSQLEKLSELTDGGMVNAAGETFVLGHKLLDSQGKLLWTYPDQYRGVQASNQVPWGFTTRPPGVVCGSIGTVGNFKIGDESFFCVGGNNGDYYTFTRDGLLAAAIVGGPRGYGLRYFSMPECIPGKTDLSDLRKTVEDFHGHVTRAEDGNVYAIAGKNHVTLMRVDGLEKMRRFEGTIDVTRDDLLNTQQWSVRSAQIERFLASEGPKRYPVAFTKKKLTIDGDILTDWPEGLPATIHQTLDMRGQISKQWQARLAFDNTNLYIGGTGMDDSPLVNSAVDPQVLFQHGDALDLQLGLDAASPVDRTEPVAGDVRLLLAYRQDKPVVMLYRYVSDATTAGKKEPDRIFRSPVGETVVAEIRELKDAQVAVVRTGNRYSLEAAIPWSALNAKPPTKVQTLRGDFGALVSDPNGQTTVARYYWSNKKQVFLGDQPAEARVLPSTWGELEFQAPNEIDSLLDKP